MNHVNAFELEVGTSGSAGKKRRFSIESNIQYTFDSAEELVQDTKELSAILKHHIEHQRPRLTVLDDYYLGENTTISAANRRKEDDKADHRAKHNYAKYVSNFMQGFFVGAPVSVRHKDKSTQEKINEINETIEDAALNADIVLDLSIYGRAYELIHRNHLDQIKVYLSSPL
ncbi:phage portal protein [Bacillus sp. KH172YL63]|uniref:phage portal protein n=1 Tax=Bacillus sp. KH172YL63 TaxID=2709784 RepID=UPI0013E4F49C|nr:phage portal protein [Bacillus sp. KH172YL63]BCB04779.1 hypothetical protein KH172YL63_29120 [Bacillus sp. KH172YL63]